MITYKIEGLSEVIRSLNEVGKQATNKEFDDAVRVASEPIVKELKAQYEPLRTEVGKASEDTHIGDSVRAFQEKKQVEEHSLLTT